MITALQLLSTVAGESLDLGGGDGGELRGEEFGWEGGLGVERVDVDETVVCDGHRHCGGIVAVYGGVGGW